jgi:PleD family two-component response regulator
MYARAGLSIAQTVSIGVAAWDGRETPESLEERADLAMYEAKRRGRDRVVSASELDAAQHAIAPPAQPALR